MSNFPNWFNVTAKANFESLIPNSMKENPDVLALQIGVYTGDATEWLSANTKWIINDVDTWQGSQEEAHEQIDFNEVEVVYDSRHLDNASVHKFKMTSDAFFNNYAYVPNTYDFVYIDGDHTASQTAKDGINAFQLLKSGGIIAFDDYTWTAGKGLYYDPRPGIDAFYHICQELLDVLVINGQAWFRKK
jgi:hypothetical protein